jgi:hypothetical protein
VNEEYAGEYETEIETADECGIESQFESCDGGTNFDEDEPEFLEALWEQRGRGRIRILKPRSLPINRGS